MNIKRVISFIFIFFLGSSIHAKVNKNPFIAIFDTARSEEYRYKSVLDEIRSNNFSLRYYPLRELIDISVKEIPFDDFDSCFFLLSQEMLGSIDRSPISKKIIQIMKTFSEKTNKTIGLFFPSSCRLPTCYSNFFDSSGFELYKVTKLFLRSPLESRKTMYHTTLKLPQNNGIRFEYGSNFTKEVMPFAFLPVRQNSCLEIKNLFPFGVYWFDKKKNNHFIVGSLSIFSCTGIEENYFLCPINPILKEKLKQAVNNFIDEICLLITQDKQDKGLNVKRIINTPIKKDFKPNFISIRGKKFSVAWMEIKTQEPELSRLMKFIFDSNLNYLWITINPNMYYSPNAKNGDKKDEFLGQISLFTSSLKKEAIRKNMAPPKILIGFEIVNNFNEKNLPKESARDLYGSEYIDVPSPLSLSFWQNEIKTPLEKFIKDWNSVSNGIVLGGVIIDLEMYCRKTACTFLPTMGFSQQSISGFMEKRYFRDLPIHTFTEYLINNRLGSEYFSYLESSAERIGSHLKLFFNKNLPSGLIACYAPIISTDWFYKGFYKGLSSEKDPLYLFTFNSEMAEHRKWLESKGIHIKHASVLMLSKLQDKNDFYWTDKIIKRHNGIWLNRFSRLAELYHRDWSISEQTKMNFGDRSSFVKHLNRICRSD